MLRLFSDIQVMLEQIGVFRTSCKAQTRCARRLFPGETPCPVVTGRCPLWSRGAVPDAVPALPPPPWSPFRCRSACRLHVTALLSCYSLLSFLFSSSLVFCSSFRDVSSTFPTFYSNEFPGVPLCHFLFSVPESCFLEFLFHFFSLNAVSHPLTIVLSMRPSRIFRLGLFSLPGLRSPPGVCVS